MKIDTGKQTQERRRKRLFTPLIYCILEIILAWLILSLINVDFSLIHWHSVSYLIFAIAVSYSLFRMYNVYQRQKAYKEKRN
ncbi:MAG TPA: hypothetical protein ENK86_05045 [Campylobacterales bacterium]|nr:hypothetical protein [Campylobacterales bacterium]